MIRLFLIFLFMMEVNAKTVLLNDSIYDFYSTTRVGWSEEEKNQINEAIFETDSCIKFLRDGESFWKNSETDTFKVLAHGINFLKVRRIVYLNQNTEQWYIADISQTIAYPMQKQYMKTDCPHHDEEIKGEDLVNLMNRR